MASSLIPVVVIRRVPSHFSTGVSRARTSSSRNSSSLLPTPVSETETRSSEALAASAGRLTETVSLHGDSDIRQRCTAEYTKERSSFRWGEEAEMEDAMVREGEIQRPQPQFPKRKSRIVQPVAGVPPPSDRRRAAPQPRRLRRVETRTVENQNWRQSGGLCAKVRTRRAPRLDLGRTNGSDG